MEVWKPIAQTNGRYSVSNMGNVRNNDHFGKIRPLKPCLNAYGYPQVLILAPTPKTCRVHRLVVEAFLEAGPTKREVNHKNGIKTDNRVENLEYCTRGENIQHAYNLGLRKRPAGSRHWKAQLLESQVIEMRSLYKSGKSVRFISNLFTHGYDSTYQIVSGRSWKHIPL